jgi:hypothetical protein
MLEKKCYRTMGMKRSHGKRVKTRIELYAQQKLKELGYARKVAICKRREKGTGGRKSYTITHPLPGLPGFLYGLPAPAILVPAK